ncbi:MAG TPA: penicillin-binding protein 2 [Thermomicrobiales bacterium]|nr:penicillin-binding protein 2 [Thermomicrobiales bacterium]
MEGSSEVSGPKPPRRPASSSPRAPRASSGVGGRRVSTPRPTTGRGPGGNWSGSSQWSPYQRRDKLWPRILLMVSVVGVLIFGSVLVASRLAGGGEDDEDGTPNPAAVVTGTAEAIASPTGSDGTPETGITPRTEPTGDATPRPTNTPVDVGEINTARDIADAYAEVWSNGNYDQLYGLLGRDARARITHQQFVDRYEGIAVEAGLVTVDARVTGGQDDDELFPLQVTFESSRIGSFDDQMMIPVIPEDGTFVIDWTPSLIFSQLGDGLVRWSSDIPQRGRILDRKGRPLAQMGLITRIGVVPGNVTDEPAMLRDLSRLVELPEDEIRARISGGQPDWFMPVKDMPDVIPEDLVNQLRAIPGVAIQKWPARVYPAGPAAAHVVGYMSEITAEELPELARLGYEAGDLVGRSGIEATMEEWLAGKRGGILQLINQDGSTIRLLGETRSEPAHDLVLTLDLDMQQATLQAMGDQTGASVVLDPNNGEVLAMVSTPTFDPNQFILGVSDELWAELNDPATQPLINRATIVGYPIGSTFKVVTASAGMAHLGLNAGSVYNCPGTFSIEGSEQTWSDWVPGGQGELDLHNALVRSCNTVFYRMGEQLDEMDEMLLPDMTRAFGFGARTGLPELFEIPGVVPDPDWKLAQIGDFWARGDAVNLAIGQGFFLGTPLQLANAYAAIANGGTLYQPHLTLDIVRLDGTVVQSGEVKEIGRLPISGEQIGVLQTALHDVINASNGTATEAFRDSEHQVSGKTGTAETGQVGELDHAWFGSWSPSNGPRIVVVTLVEHGRAGSVAAAPVARRVIDAWYSFYP